MKLHLVQFTLAPFARFLYRKHLLPHHSWHLALSLRLHCIFICQLDSNICFFGFQFFDLFVQLWSARMVQLPKPRQVCLITILELIFFFKIFVMLAWLAFVLFYSFFYLFLFWIQLQKEKEGRIRTTFSTFFFLALGMALEKDSLLFF